jgi:hypothetical protein
MTTKKFGDFLNIFFLDKYILTIIKVIKLT